MPIEAGIRIKQPGWEWRLEPSFKVKFEKLQVLQTATNTSFGQISHCCEYFSMAFLNYETFFITGGDYANKDNVLLMLSSNH